MNKSYDIIVVGAGHAGIEASLASSRMHCKTLLVTMDIDKIGFMSCNPAVGGIGKGQLVKELDALGGEMAKATDACAIQFRMLNRSKGPAVWSSRAQVDRKLYNRYMLQAVKKQDNLELLQDEAEEILVKNNKITGITTKSGLKIKATCVVIASGTFLEGFLHFGQNRIAGGRVNEKSSKKLSHSLKDLGLKIMKFKTCTPPRIDGKTVSFSKMKAQKGDNLPQPFSFTTKKLKLEQVPCYLTYTNKRTHKIITDNLSLAPILTGEMEGADVRYCPSIEAKIARFPDRDRHQIFIEPEGLDTDEKYCNGLFTSLPVDIQEKILRTIAGLEKVKITKPGYGVEYDVVDSKELLPSLETKKIKGLFFAGQVNGTTGYEEAAVQGLIAGINAGLKAEEKDPFILDRSEAYIGVLIDDLVTKGTNEPYRMFTSRVEYRLLLREDNADLRLTEFGYKVGIRKKIDYKKVSLKKKRIAQEIERLKKTRVSVKNNYITLFDYLKRPEVNYRMLEGRFEDDIMHQVEIELKYKGFIDRQIREIENFKKIENIRIPERFEFKGVPGLSNEIIEKLSEVRPMNLGQASRISGVTPVAISILMVYIKKYAKGISI